MKESTALDCVKLFSSDLDRRMEHHLLHSPIQVPRSGVGRCESGVFLRSVGRLGTAPTTRPYYNDSGHF